MRVTDEASMHDDARILTALTDFLMAGEALCFAVVLARRPKQRSSAVWHWTGAMSMLCLGALLGGLDHGYFEARALPHFAIQRASWLVVGVMTYFVLMATATQFFLRKTVRVTRIAGLAQLAVYAGAVLTLDTYLVVVLNYAPVILVWLLMHSRGIRLGTGSWEMAGGTAVMFVATAIQVSGYDGLAPLDHDGLYHLVSMIGIAGLFAGARHLSPRCEPALSTGVTA
jgi:hypothetical protein